MNELNNSTINIDNYREIQKTDTIACLKEDECMVIETISINSRKYDVCDIIKITNYFDIIKSNPNFYKYVHFNSTTNVANLNPEFIKKNDLAHMIPNYDPADIIDDNTILKYIKDDILTIPKNIKQILLTKPIIKILNDNKIIEAVEAVDAAEVVEDIEFKTIKAIEFESNSEIRSISESAFSDCKILFKLNLPHILAINARVFYGCINLTEINLPWCNIIYKYAFYGCNKLTKLDLPKGFAIFKFAFALCSLLSEIHLPNINKIGEFAFWDCNIIGDLYLPNVEAIFDNAFLFCYKITRVYLPKITIISICAFSNCRDLIELHLPKKFIENIHDKSYFNDIINDEFKIIAIE